MKLSVIIVNYNVKHFLEQCLRAAVNACKNISSEIIVVDNHSVDQSNQMVIEKFPSVKLIKNEENVGFSKANNQAMRIAKGEYVLLLNPDTLVEEDTFEKVISFMDQHPEAGGLGIKMIDGNGHFLPESKRALPTPKVAFYKIFGLSKLFPKSKTFGKYHLSYLDKDQTHEVEILSGAFMLMRKSVLDKIGLLDETFFMYGEDIDLSYRIILGGYKNYYFADSTIIHYKGESTKKGSLNYVKTFYNAMIIFSKKHFSSSARLLISIIHFAIYLRAAIALFKRIFKQLLIPFLDLAILSGGFLFLTRFWEQIKYYDGYYDKNILTIIYSIILLLFLLSIYLSGGYYKPVKISKLLKGIGLGSILSLAGYSLLDESIRFSRILILMAIAWAFVALPLYRWVLHQFNIFGFQYKTKKKKRFIIVGNSEEASRVEEILHNTHITPIVVGYINEENNSKTLGNLNSLIEIIQIHKINEVIFCAKDISAQKIISNILLLNTVNCDFKIASPDSVSVIGSSSIHTNGELYQIELSPINSQENKRDKRFLDFSLAFILLILYPIVILFQKEKRTFIQKMISVINGKYSFVGYNSNLDKTLNLPPIKKGLLSTKNNIEYAKNYSIYKDLQIIYKQFRLLDVRF